MDYGTNPLLMTAGTALLWAARRAIITSLDSHTLLILQK